MAHEMANNSTLAFELGFDWNVHPIVGVRNGVFPLQVSLVDDNNGTVLSPSHPSAAKVGDTLLFRVYDFTDPDHLSAGSPEPSALQVLFSSASTVTSPEPPFSPVVIDENPLAQLAATSFNPNNVPPSIAYGADANGWKVEWNLGADIVLQQPGRFNFRALLTVGITGEMARFYRADPEMVVGDAGGGGGFKPPH